MPRGLQNFLSTTELDWSLIYLCDRKKVDVHSGINGHAYKIVQGTNELLSTFVD